MQKKQLMPQEIEVWYIIPAIRRELVREMINLGLKQNKIAEVLGITPSAVSQYVKQKRAKEVIFTDEIMDEIRKSARIVADDPERLIFEVQKLLGFTKRSKTLCKVHYQHGRMPQKCEACLNVGEK
ncbi:transcriptional regulator [Candidatus Woesearchaeota archaeon CG10_big_fil_rev_8_21_14_0_10_44_13]|nr:MAG: transcriptional regulator [Candidatus Woesearchaeota archaeon CG10_big_fil_rev_8_21_14_0_10_44_13]